MSLYNFINVQNDISLSAIAKPIFYDAQKQIVETTTGAIIIYTSTFYCFLNIAIAITIAF